MYKGNWPFHVFHMQNNVKFSKGWGLCLLLSSSGHKIPCNPDNTSNTYKLLPRLISLFWNCKPWLIYSCPSVSTWGVIQLTFNQGKMMENLSRVKGVSFPVPWLSPFYQVNLSWTSQGKIMDRICPDMYWLTTTRQWDWPVSAGLVVLPLNKQNLQKLL